VSTEAGTTEQQELVNVSNEVDFVGFFTHVAAAFIAWQQTRSDAIEKEGP
jgi:hypothetical protein